MPNKKCPECGSNDIMFIEEREGGDIWECENCGGVCGQDNPRTLRLDPASRGVFHGARGLNRCSEGFFPSISKGNSGKNPIERSSF